MSKSRCRAQIRLAVLRFYHAVEWIVVAVFITGAILVAPELRESPAFLAGCAVWIASALVFARLRWPIRKERYRLIVGFVLTLMCSAALAWFLRPSLNGLFVTFMIVTTTAWIVLPVRWAVGVVGFAFLTSAVAIIGPEPDVANILFAVALGASCIVTAYLAEISVIAAARAEASAAAISPRDELTGLQGRQAFLREAQQFHALADESKTPYAIEIVDINNLRAINDTFGYTAGDRAILVVAQALQRLRAPDESIARYEGDKFALLVPQLDGNRADELARRIRSVIFATTINVDSEVVRIKANVGVAKYPLAGVTTSALVSAAERDMKLDQRGREPPGKKPVFKRRSGSMSA